MKLTPKQDWEKYLKKHNKDKSLLLGSGQYAPQSYLSFAIREQRLLSKSIAYQKGFLIGIFIILIGFVLYQDYKIKQLNQELYASKRYSHHLKEINDYVLFGDTKYNKKGE